jgi:hypothetical protein
MALDRLSLSRFLELLQLPHARRLRAIERDARRSVYEEKYGKGSSDGGDFYGPFWADAKRSVVDEVFDLAEATDERIASNKSRRRLYPILRTGFEAGWTTLRDSRPIASTLRLIPKLAVTVKGSEAEDHLRATSVLAVQDPDKILHITYPYFSKDQRLGQRHARLGLSILKQGFAPAKPRTVAILDVLRGKSFVAEDIGSDDSGKDELIDRYDAVMREWRAQKRNHR